MIILHHDQEDVGQVGGGLPVIQAVDLSGGFDEAKQFFEHVTLLPVIGKVVFDLCQTFFGGFFFFRDIDPRQDFPQYGELKIKEVKNAAQRKFGRCFMRYHRIFSRDVPITLQVFPLLRRCLFGDDLLYPSLDGGLELLFEF